ncbi:MAG TPA: ABC transporter substrate-binding protein [Candidatus Intestinimonas pullistercoris]|uniref:ABC transporter substrate-binding protein n=1 Tax=Candidatus Intestinimonas pullistercoris TaxID=2838623 RepID=A0A9D2NZK6_9FIRM|nr:ABC transporter substrate-binding protein [uncultured Intestinimonas sp.]HJC40699.1 ABC transporter substrate-binding protein [Candidatus Intestinimonas pullistercoris]
MKKFLALALSCSLALTTLAGCGGGSASTPAPEGTTPAGETTGGENTVYIGVFEPATGDSGAGGKQEMLGMQYANSETPTVDIGGTTYNVELVYADNGSDSAKAPTAAAELVGKGVSLVLGSYGSGVSIAAGPIFGEAGLAAIGVTCTNPQVTAGNDYYFRICFLDPFQGTVLANFATEKFSAQKAYLLGELGNDYDQGLMNYFEQAFTAAGGTVVKDSFPTNTSDFSTYLNKAVSEGCDVIFCPVSIAYSTQIVKLAADTDLSIPILGSDTLDNNMVLEAAAGSDVQLYVSTFYQEGGDPDFDAGIKEFINGDSTNLTNNGGNDTIAAVTAMGYDAYYVALEALKAAGSTDPGAVKAALPGVTYTGVSGDIAFDEIGDAIRDTAYIKVADTANNAWTLETVQTVTE